jgi:hypothetical protein
MKSIVKNIEILGEVLIGGMKKNGNITEPKTIQVGDGKSLG